MHILIQVLLAALLPGARGQTCVNLLAMQLEHHVQARQGSLSHDVITALSTKNLFTVMPLVFFNWLVFTNVPTTQSGWRAEGLGEFLNRHEHRNVLVDASDLADGTRAIKSLRSQESPIFLIIDFTRLPAGTWNDERYKPFWYKLKAKMNLLSGQGTISSALILLPDNRARMPLNSARQLIRPSVPRTRMTFSRLDRLSRIRKPPQLNPQSLPQRK